MLRCIVLSIVYIGLFLLMYVYKDLGGIESFVGSFMMAGVLDVYCWDGK